jgi:hypothetical protein
MAVPSADTIPRGSQLRSKKKVRSDIFIALLLMILGSLMFTIIKPTVQMVEKQDMAELPMKKFNLEKPIETVDSDLLKHEDDFLRTIKSCIPGKDEKCGMFVSEKVGKQRIAVISPPGLLGEMLWKAIQKVVKQHEHVLNKIAPFELIPGSHVPPYG